MYVEGVSTRKVTAITEAPTREAATAALAGGELLNQQQEPTTLRNGILQNF
jgi:hypothetical protein